MTALTVASRSSSSPATWTKPNISPLPAPLATIAVAPDDNKDNKTTLKGREPLELHQHGQQTHLCVARGVPHQLRGAGQHGRLARQKDRTAQALLSTHSQRHILKLILKSLLDRTSHLPGAMDEKVVLPLVRTHASIIAGSAPLAAMTFTGIPSDSSCTLTKRGVADQHTAMTWPPPGQLPQPTNRKHRARTAASSISL